jgi:flavin-dependent dehydrogenase
MKKYDIVIIGAGPGGLMAAKTAAESGLSVLVVEKKRDPAVINRACLQIFYLKWVCPDEYLEPVSVETTSTGVNRLKFEGPGFTLDYQGPFKPYLNAVWISPSGHKVYPFKDELFGYFYDKERLISQMRAAAEGAGATLLTETQCTGVETGEDGVKTRLRRNGADEAVSSRTLIAADGSGSAVVESLGLNKLRFTFPQRSKGSAYYMAGVTPLVEGHETGWVSVNIPNVITEGGGLVGRVGIGLYADGLKWVAGDYKALGQVRGYKSWFRKAEVVRTVGASIPQRTPLRNPVYKNVIAIGDAAIQEAWIQGAIACGYQAAKAIEAESEGKRGFKEYAAWWQRAFYGNDPGWYRRAACHHVFNQTCTNQELDYIYRWFEGQRVVPTLALAKNPELIKTDRPELYLKIKKALGETTSQLKPVLQYYPEGSEIFPDPDACLGRWRSSPEKSAVPTEQGDL